MKTRDIIFTRIKTALTDVPNLPIEEDVPLDWTYGAALPLDNVLDTFVEMCADYRAVVERVSENQVAETITRLLRQRAVSTVVVPTGLPATWRAGVEASGATVITDDPPKTNQELDGIEAVVTAARVGIADTGTIVLDHAADQGRRALSLVPDTHLCLIRADQVVSDVPEAVQRLKESVALGRPLTWISGPSATSDIELSRVEGVHGPRNLVILLIE